MNRDELGLVERQISQEERRKDFAMLLILLQQKFQGPRAGPVILRSRALQK